MTLNANDVKGTGPKTPPLAVGSYPARLVQLISLGLQPQRPYEGQEKPPALEFMPAFEFVDEFLKDEDGNDMLDKPRWMSKRMPFHGMHSEKAKSTQWYKVLDPDNVHEGDWTALMGTPVMVTVVHNEGKGKNKGVIYDNISGISPMRAKDVDTCPPLVNEPRVFDWEHPDMEVWEKLPDWIQDVIKGNLEFAGSELEAILNQGPDTESEVDDAVDEEEKPW